MISLDPSRVRYSDTGLVSYSRYETLNTRIIIKKNRWCCTIDLILWFLNASSFIPRFTNGRFTYDAWNSGKILCKHCFFNTVFDVIPFFSFGLFPIRSTVLLKLELEKHWTCVQGNTEIHLTFPVSLPSKKLGL